MRFAAELDGDVGGEKDKKQEGRERERDREVFWILVELVEGQRSCLLKWGKLES